MNRLKRFFQNKNSWLPISVTVISATIGIIAGPVIEAIAPPLFRGSNLIYITFFISSFLFIVVSTYALSFWKQNLKQNDAVYSKISDLAKSLGVKFVFKPIGKGNVNDVYPHVSELIRIAEKEILILNYGTTRKAKDNVSFDREIAESTAQREYYDLMAQKIEGSQRGIFKFRRIIQVPNDVKDWITLIDNTPIKHYKLLAEIGSKNPEFASLKRSSPFFDITFIVIDRRYVILAIDILDPDGKEYYTMGHLVFDDPIGEFANEFVRLFERIDAYATLVKPSELAKFK